MQKSIVIVEDEDILREIVKDYLLDQGYKVLEAVDGNEALAIFEEYEVHLIILDIMLPELDGWSVCRRIRKSSNVPIIMLTARVDEDDTLLGFELGADDYVTKPYSPPILLARVKRLMDSRYFHIGNTSNEDTLISNGIHIHFPTRTVFRDRGAKKQDLFVVRDTEMPAALIEVGYLTNPQDESQMWTDKGQNDVATAIVEGIKEYIYGDF